MRRLFQFNIGFILAVTFAVAIFFAKNVNIWIILLSSQALLILIVVWVLCRGIPMALSKASRDNCYRIDGSISPRREARERTAKSKLRSDLIAILFIVALSGNLLALAISSLVIPLPFAAETRTEFSFDTDSWRIVIPVLFCAALVWLVGSFVLIWDSYLCTMREYDAGIKSRLAEYLNVDIARMQSRA